MTHSERSAWHVFPNPSCSTVILIDTHWSHSPSSRFFEHPTSPTLGYFMCYFLYPRTLYPGVFTQWAPFIVQLQHHIIWKVCLRTLPSKTIFFGGGWFLVFRATAVAYGSSQARGWIRTAASGLRHRYSNTRSEPCWQTHCSSQQCWILNPLSGARDRTLILMHTSWVRYPWATTATPQMILYHGTVHAGHSA